MDALFRLCLLGAPRVTLDGQPVTGFRTRKCLALLCYLAARSTELGSNAPLSRMHLTNLFWGDLPESNGRSNLSYTLHNLNALFPNALHATRETIALNEDIFVIDTREFDAHAALATEDSLTAAAALYHDEFMAGVFLDDCPEFEVWLVGERERWRQRIVSVLECLSGDYARHVEYEKALPYAARILDIEPWREEAHRHMMLLLACTGQRSAALQQYETCRRVLAEELGAEPGAETRALYEQIRAEEFAPAPRGSAPNNMPMPLTSFVGREADLARIAVRMNNPDCRLLTLVGAGGIGKTRLALEAGKNLLGTFHDGVFFVPLASIAPGQGEFIVPEIANALGFTLAGPEDPKTQLLNFLRGKKMLLLLDNLEQLLSSAEGSRGIGLVLEILQHAPNLKILATSREPLNVQAEWLTRVMGLSYPTSLVTPVVGQNREAGESFLHYSAVQLFVERASRVDQDFALDAETSVSVVRICQSVEGMPLALELAAAALKSVPVGKIAEQIALNVDLTTPMRDVETRHQSLRAVLDWSYGLLCEPEQTLFGRLSVFAGGWTLEAAEEVCAGGIVDQGHVLNCLNNLVAKSLVLIQYRDVETRYRMLEPVCQYASEKLKQNGEGTRVRTRHLEYFVTLAEQVEPNLEGAEQQSWLDLLESEHDNFRAALAWANEINKAQSELRLAGALGRFWYRRGYFVEGQRYLEQALNAAQNDFAPWRAKAFNGAGMMLFAQGDYSGAQTLLEQSVALYRASGEKQELAFALNNLGFQKYLQGDLHGATLVLEEGLELARQVEDSRRIALLLNSLGELARYQGDYARARTLYEESLALARRTGDRQRIAEPLFNLGCVLNMQGDHQAAQSLFGEGLILSEESGDKRLIAAYLGGLAGTRVAQGMPEQAARLFGAAEALREEIHYELEPTDRADYECHVAALREAIDAAAFAAAWAEGRAMTLEQAITYTLERENHET